MSRFIEENREVFGVWPICKVLPIAPTSYYARAAIMRDPELASDRAKIDIIDCKDIKRVYKASVTAPVKSGMPCGARARILHYARWNV